MWKEISLEECKKRKEYYIFPIVFSVLTLTITLGYMIFSIPAVCQLFILMEYTSVFHGLIAISIIGVCCGLLYTTVFLGIVKKVKKFYKIFIALNVLFIFVLGSSVGLVYSDFSLISKANVTELNSAVYQTEHEIEHQGFESERKENTLEGVHLMDSPDEAYTPSKPVELRKLSTAEADSIIHQAKSWLSLVFTCSLCLGFIFNLVLFLYTQYSKIYRLQFLHQVRKIDL